MTLQEQLREDLKQAMKSGETQKRDVIRFLESAVKNVAIDKRKPATDLTDEEVQEVIKRSVKQRKDSIEQYTTGNRLDLAGKEQEEVEILQAYLPQMMEESAVQKLVEQSLAESGVTEMKDFGKAMGAAMKLVAGRADGTVVKRLLEEALKK
ncbi:MAG: GatB/YqeY domain-containing protein [Candidatus Moraniibacteriota bacterium]